MDSEKEAKRLIDFYLSIVYSDYFLHKEGIVFDRHYDVAKRCARTYVNDTIRLLGDINSAIANVKIEILYYEDILLKINQL